MSLAIVAGELPTRARRLVNEWAEAHREELRDNWERARRHERLRPVELSYLAELGGVFEPLRDATFFRQLRVDPEAGTII